MSLHFIFRIRIKVGLARGRQWACFGWNVWSCELEGVSSLLFQQRVPCLNQQQASGSVWLGEEQSDAWGHMGSSPGDPSQLGGSQPHSPPQPVFPLLAGKMSTFSSTTKLDTSPLPHVKENPSYNRVSVVGGIKSKNIATHQHGGGADGAAKGAASNRTGNRIYPVVKAGCQKSSKRQPQGEKRWARVRLRK